MYDNLRKSESKMLNEIEDNNNHEPFRLGFAVADILTSYWNSKENPPKTYLFNRRVHHGTIGALLGLSNLYKKIKLLLVFCQGWVQVFKKTIIKIPKNGFYLRKKRMKQIKINNSRRNLLKI